MHFVSFITLSALLVAAQAASTAKPEPESSHKHTKRHSPLEGGAFSGASYPSYATSLTSSGFDQAASLLTKDTTSITSAEFGGAAAISDTAVGAEYAPAAVGAVGLPAPAAFPAAAPCGHDVQLAKEIVIKNKIGYHVPQPYPVRVEKPVPYQVIKTYPVKVDKPYTVHVPKPYPVTVVKPVPYKVDKPVPYPVAVKVPYPVYERVPVHIPKAIPYPVVRKPVCVHSKMELVPLHSLGAGYAGLAAGYTGFAAAGAAVPYAAAGGFATGAIAAEGIATGGIAEYASEGIAAHAAYPSAGLTALPATAY